MEHQDAIDTMFDLIYEMGEAKCFSESYDEELEESDSYNEHGDLNQMTYKQLQEVTEDFGNSHYMMMRAVIESIKKYKEDFEKQVRAKEAYKKVNKKQSDKIKELKKENEKLKEENEEQKKELLISAFNGYKEGCNCKQSVEDEIYFLNESGESQELIKEVFDESYQGGLNLVYNIETKDYEEYEEEDSESEEEEEICSECKRKKECKSDMFVTIRELDGTEYIMCGMCSLTHFKNKRDGLK